MPCMILWINNNNCRDKQVYIMNSMTSCMTRKAGNMEGEMCDKASLIQLLIIIIINSVCPQRNVVHRHTNMSIYICFLVISDRWTSVSTSHRTHSMITSVSDATPWCTTSALPTPILSASAGAWDGTTQVPLQICFVSYMF